MGQAPEAQSLFSEKGSDPFLLGWIILLSGLF